MKSRTRSIKKALPKPLKRVIRSTIRTFAVRTAERRVLPDFLIIGAKRGGTTSLWNWLVRHPHVEPMFPAAQQIKSPHYFDIHYDQGLNWYRSHFPTQEALLALEKRMGIRPLCGEASPYYLFHPLAAERAHAVVPEAKIIVSLRNPVDRAYSNYHERLGSGVEVLPTFEDAIAAEHSRLAGTDALVRTGAYSPEHDSHSYLARGHYADQLTPWLTHYDRANILILRLEDFKTDEAGEYRRVQEFLGLPIEPAPPTPRHNRLPVPPMNPETRSRLLELYADSNAKLEQLLGRPFNWNT
ncbi:MAG: sulfotransferase [Corynebacteriales bacterium]|nr:sulfotransferase [Mycobacteriales bacterium]